LLELKSQLNFKLIISLVKIFFGVIFQQNISIDMKNIREKPKTPKRATKSEFLFFSPLL
jgi:hypothetical protein